jgi:group I intron endonuclease
MVFYNALVSKNNIIKDYKNVSDIYLLHNSVNGKQYIGSGYDLSLRLSSYYYPSKLIDKRYISNSILKYGHDNFSVVILDILGYKNFVTKTNLIKKEQYFIDLYKPDLNINAIAGSILGFKHTDETKKFLAKLRKGKNLSEETKQRLSALFSGELNPFLGKIHNTNTLNKMRKSKLGELNPMFNKEKSQEFKKQMFKDKSGINNPMYGKTHSIKTLEKLRKKVYVYNTDTKQLEKVYEGIVIASKDLKIGYKTLKKYCESNKIYKNKIFSLNPLNF